ncbi:MAG: choice-of-anchor D domain-containing protein [Kofleriaceae bacterium]
MNKLAIVCVSLLWIGCGDDGGAPKDAPEDAGIDAGPAMLSGSPMTASFGSVVVGQTSTPMTITITNTGGFTTGTINPAISGSMGSNFVLGSSTCTSLAASATCTIDVSFRPSSAGAKTAQLAVTAAPGGTLMVDLDGTGIVPGALAIAPTTHNFGTRTIGLGGSAQVFTVTNTGGEPTTAMTSVVGGANPGEFIKTGDTCDGMTLAGGATCTFTLAFTPLTGGVKFGNVTVSASAGGVVTTAVNGNGATQARLVAIPTSIEFGTVGIGSPSSTVIVSVFNAGDVAAGAITPSATGNPDFQVVTTSCNGATLGPSESCTFVVRFTPAVAGPRSAQFMLTAKPGGSAVVDAAGTGITPGELSIEPSPATFASTVIGTTSPTTTFTVRNTGGSATGPLDVLLGGNDPNQFTITNNLCNVSSLPPAGTCTITVAFAPVTVGPRTATLIVSAIAGGTTQAALSGQGLPRAQLAITPLSKDFGSVGVGTMSSPQAFVVENTGGGPTTAAPVIALTGVNADQFTRSDDCLQVLAPTETCTVLVRFTPTALGDVTATLTATAGTSTATADVFGQGVAPDALTVNPSSLPFPGTVLLGNSSANDLSFTVTNNGGATTGMLNVSVTGAAAADFSIISTTCGALPSLGTCSVTVRFTPTAGGARNASIVVAGSPGGSVSVAVSGDALASITIVSVAGAPPTIPYNFGTRSVGSNTCVAVVVRNNTNQSHTLTRTGDYGIPPEYSHTAGSCVPASPATIAANGTVTQVVRFSPTSIGTKPGSLTFSIGAGAANEAMQMFTGIGAHPLTITPVTSADFGLTARNSTSHPLQFRVTNASDAPTSGAITTAVLQTQRFRITSDLCNGIALAPNTSCLITVVFEPLADGPDTAVLGVSAMPGGSASLNLNGTGTLGVTLGGTVTGHNVGGTLILRNNGYDDVLIAANQGTFTFPRRIGSVYSVTVVQNPTSRICVVSANASGVAGITNVTNVQVTCTPGVLITPLGEAFGHHGVCSGWNGCGNAQTCAQWACAIRGQGALISFGAQRPCTQWTTCHLFYNQTSIQNNWGNSCGVMGVSEIVCQPL